MWPIEAGLRDAATKRLPSGPPSPAAGSTLLLAYERGEGSLWQLVPEMPTTDGDAAFIVAAERALERSIRVVLRGLPVLPSSQQIDATVTSQWCARAIPLGGGNVFQGALTGPSFGLAFALAVASRMTGLPIPGDICATAVVDDGGRLHPVEGIEAKLACLLDRAPGVDRLLVAHTQAESAREWLEANPRSGQHTPKVVALKTVDEAFEHVFTQDALVQKILPRPTDSYFSRMAHHIFRMALNNERSAIGWGAMAELATRMRALGVSENIGVELDRRLDIAAKIASRHAGKSSPIDIDDEFVSKLPDEPRRRLRAHIVQSASDSSSTLPHELACRALDTELSGRKPSTEGELFLVGAAGRAYAAAGEYAQAAKLLQLAVEGWFANERPAEAARPLCELVRVLGVTKNADALKQLLSERFQEVLIANMADPMSTAYALLAQGRALVQIGDHEGAQRALMARSDAWWDATPQHVCHSRKRWLAHALLPRDPEQATQLRDELKNSPKAEVVQLIALERLLDSPNPDSSAVVAVLEHIRETTELHELHRILDRVQGDSLARAQALVNQYPY